MPNACLLSKWRQLDVDPWSEKGSSNKIYLSNVFSVQWFKVSWYINSISIYSWIEYQSVKEVLLRLLPDHPSRSSPGTSITYDLKVQQSMYMRIIIIDVRKRLWRLNVWMNNSNLSFHSNSHYLFKPRCFCADIKRTRRLLFFSC